MAIPLILADDDKAYVNRVADWMLVHPESGFQPVVADVCLPDAISSGSGAPVVLYGGTYWKAIVEASAGMHAILLQDGTDAGPADSGKNTRMIPSVAKFQPISGLLQDILAIANERGWKLPARTRAGNIPLTVAVHLSGAIHMQPIIPLLSVLSARLRKTLYLDLDPAGHSGLWFPPGGGHGLSRLAYHVHSGSEEWMDRFENCLFQDAISGVFTLREPDLPEDAAGLGASEVRAIRSAAGRCGFGILMIDAGLGLDRRNLSLLPEANRIFLVCGNDAAGLRRASAAASLLNGSSAAASLFNGSSAAASLFNGSSAAASLLNGSSAAASLLNGSSDGLLLRESSELHWIFCGGGKLAGNPDIPSGHFVHVLPDAYPEGFPRTGWAADWRLLSELSAFDRETGEIPGPEARDDG